MFLADAQLETTADGKFRLYCIGDLHADRKAFQAERFKRWRRAITKDPHAVALFLGDAFEGRTPGQKHFNVGTLRPPFVLNLERYVDFCLGVGEQLLKPITDAGRPLFTIRGNHDSYQEWSGFSGALARRCGATYLDGAGLIRLRTGTPGRYYTTTIYATHGWGGGRAPGPKLNNLMALRGVCDADIYCAAHVHDQMARVVPMVTVPSKGALRLVRRDVAFLRAAAFLGQGAANEGGYDQDQAYPASDNGLVVLEVDPPLREDAARGGAVLMARRRASTLPPLPREVLAPTAPVPVVCVAELRDAKGRRTSGLWTSSPRRIALDASLSRVDAWWTLHHETMHAVLYDRLVRLKREDEEAVANAYADHMMLAMQQGRARCG